MLKLILTICFSLLSLILRITAKLRLTIPMLYLLGVGISTVFTDWANQHEQQVLLGLYAQLFLVALSWIVTQSMPSAAAWMATGRRTILHGSFAVPESLAFRWTASALTAPTTSSIPERGCP